MEGSDMVIDLDDEDKSESTKALFAMFHCCLSLRIVERDTKNVNVCWAVPYCWTH